MPTRDEVDFLIGTEMAARAFNKLRGKVVRLELADNPETLELSATMRVGNYIVNFDGERVEGCGLIQYRVKDVSDAR
jgi:hypothetical protein